MARTQNEDWHPADIICALRKAGTTLRQLSLTSGYSQSAGKVALQKPWPAVERLIAARIGVKPQDIWPSRYDAYGHPIRRRNRTTRARSQHVQRGAAA